MKFDPGFRVIGESLSQIDTIYQADYTQIFSNYSCRIPGRILVLPVTQHFRSK